MTHEIIKLSSYQWNYYILIIYYFYTFNINYLLTCSFKRINRYFFTAFKKFLKYINSSI